MSRSRDEDVDYRILTTRRGGGSPSAFWQKALLVLLTVGVIALLALNVVQMNQIGNLKGENIGLTDENRSLTSQNIRLRDRIKELEDQLSRLPIQR